MQRLRITAILCAALLLAGFLHAQQAQEPQASEQKVSEPKAKEKLPIEQILERLPRRVTSKTGTAGDMVNFLLVGTKQQVEDSLKAAGWVQVDRTPEDAITHAIQEMAEHRAYSEMPMSQLYLFGRPQDYGWAEGIPIHIVTERNHFRLWESPWLTQEGQTVWVGAGTHDIDIEQDTLGNLTHKIDPDVDLEREYIAGSLADAGKVKDRTYLSPSNPVQQAVTATGAPFHSDGRIAVISLK